ncbi:MAG TPA: DUF421 domain-containing protein [Syntrophomonadaceae bacterium]|nr:DUF421 domain-containing protein [Syntrophomonadaceae bacterium]
MLLIAVRALILYAVLVVVMRLMGKRQIGQLQPFELVITIVIAELAVIPMSNTGIPLSNGIIGILVLLAAEIFLSLLVLHSEPARKIICGTPTILINNGKLMTRTMRRLRVNLNDLLEQLRSKEYPNVSDIAYAVLENNGTLSVIPRASVKPPAAKDLGTAVTEPRFPITLILDGHVNLHNLQLAGITVDTLMQQAEARGIDDLRDVFFAQLTTDGTIDFHLKGEGDDE